MRTSGMDIPLIACYIWHYRDGKPWCRLYDAYDSEVSMGFLINHPQLAQGCHGKN